MSSGDKCHRPRMTLDAGDALSFTADSHQALPYHREKQTLSDISAPRPGPEHQLLGRLIGKWMNDGSTVATPEAPAERILTSDVYEWTPGGFFVIHSAYGRISNLDVGSIEMIGYDQASKGYKSYNFDSQGNVSTMSL